MVGAESNVPSPDARRHRFMLFLIGFGLGAVVNLVVIVGLLYLKMRDTSEEPWETLSIATAGALWCISPVQVTVSVALGVIRRVRWLSAGLTAAAILGVIALAVLLVWSGGQAERYAELNNLT